MDNLFVCSSLGNNISFTLNTVLCVGLRCYFWGGRGVPSLLYICIMVYFTQLLDNSYVGVASNITRRHNVRTNILICSYIFLHHPVQCSVRLRCGNCFVVADTETGLHSSAF